MPITKLKYDIDALIKIYEKKNINLSQSVYNEIANLINQAYTKIAYVSQRAKLVNGKLPKTILKQIDALVETLNTEIEARVTTGIVKSWVLAEEKNDIIETQVENSGGNKKPPTKSIILSDDLNENYDLIKTNFGGGSQKALQEFIERKENGLTLSDRIYLQGDYYKDFIEDTLTETIKSGTSARDTAKRLINTVNPEAQGQGIYADPKKNTLRLAANEINISYRTADYNRWQKQWFVKGIRVKTSNNHPKFDVCDAMQGQYPKQFLFKGWHIRCRCFATPIIVSDKENEAMIDYQLGNRNTEPKINYVKDIPQAAKDWVSDNLERMKGWKSKPDFLEDNKEYF